MNWRTAERGAWTLGIGGFLAVLLGALLSPDPTRILPSVAGSLVVTLPVAYWYVNRQQDEFPTEGVGRLTVFFLALFAVSYVGFEIVEFATAADTSAETAGRALSALVALFVARRMAYRDGYDRLRAALD